MNSILSLTLLKIKATLKKKPILCLEQVEFMLVTPINSNGRREVNLRRIEKEMQGILSLKEFREHPGVI